VRGNGSQRGNPATGRTGETRVSTDVLTPDPHIALVGSPNAGKTSIFNGLTGLRAKTGNYPGVTVSRYVGRCRTGERAIVIEDLPGTYSLEPISPDERVTIGVLNGTLPEVSRPDAVAVAMDATTLHRSLLLLAQVLALGLPTCVVLTFTDELARRRGRLEVVALAQALGLPVVPVVGHRGEGLPRLREVLEGWPDWPQPPVSPPPSGPERDAWVESVLDFASHRYADTDDVTRRVDDILLHPVWGTAVFLAVMFLFFQALFGLAAPLQGYVESGFDQLSGLVSDHVTNRWLAGLLGDALIGGVGGVLVFVPQIALLFLLIALLEGIGYMSRAAFLMDRVMAKAGLEGRAFVALLSSVACAVPGIMATRTLPSARDRIATMMASPLMTCSARLPVYVLLVGLLVDPSARWGPFGAQGLAVFSLYLLGAVSAMVAAWGFQRIRNQRGVPMPFYLEMPPYRIPRLRSVLLAMWEAARTFLRKCTTIILATAFVLWLALNLPIQSTSRMASDGIATGDPAAVTAYTVDHSYAAQVGHAVSPVFAPLGFDWRINIGVLSAQSARETFIATLSQVASAQDPQDPGEALRAMTYDSGDRAGQPVFTAATIAALLAFFAFALQCMSTIGVIRRETGTWRWPAIAFGYLFVTAWLMALLARTSIQAVLG
jgi:ferrous iron transport protein B